MDIEYDSSVGPPRSADVLHNLGYFGHYLHLHAGGRGGKQFVLITLAKSGGHLTQRELLERSRISSASLSEVLSKLEAEGLIRRTACTNDRRQLNIELTGTGLRRARHTQARREQFEREAFSCLSEQEFLTLKALTDKVKSHWEAIQESEASA